jgi:hypothetical protein
MQLEERLETLGIRPRGRKRSNNHDSFRLPEMISSSVDDKISTRNKRNHNVGFKQIRYNLLTFTYRLLQSMGLISVPLGRHKTILNPLQLFYSLKKRILLFSFSLVIVFTFQTGTSISNINIVREDYSFHDSISIGRFLSPSRPFQSYHNTDYFEYNDYTSQIPDYGDLSLTILDDIIEQSFVRKIKSEPEMFHGHVWASDEYESNQFDDAYYALDDDHVRSTSFTDINLKCRRTAFHRMYHPNCNLFHELFLKEGKYLG